MFMKKNVFLWVLGLAIAGSCLVAGSVQAANTMAPEVKVFNDNMSGVEKSFLAWPASNQNGGTIAVGDIDGNGYGEIIVGAGRGSGPHIRIFSKNGVNQGLDFFAFSKDFHGGVSVAAGDVDGDGKEEIIVGQRSKGQAWVKIYRGDKNRTIVAQWLAYSGNFQGGVNVAAGDFNGDGKDEVVTAPGTSGGAQIKFFDGKGKPINKSFFAFDPGEKGGATLASADVDGDGSDELVVGHGPFGDPRVKLYRIVGNSEFVLADWRAHPSGFRGGVKVAAGDIDGNGTEEILTAAGWGGGPHVQGWTAAGKLYKITRMAYASDFRGSLNLATGDIDRDNKLEIVTIPDRRPGDGRLDYFRYVDVSIAEQRLRAFENGELVRTYLVSTGTAKHPTPTGTFRIQGHTLSTRMAWVYGPDNPDNYDLPNVPHVMPINGPITIHGAYWHHNFGHRMSHGCINEPLDQAAWLYAWARNGDPVIVH